MSMMQHYITRQNYEEWFMDFLDGTMSPERKVLLFEFLSLNADLKSELEALQLVEFPKLQIPAYPGKHRLLRTSSANIDLPETDFLLIKKMEEGLTEQETKRLAQLEHFYPAIKTDEKLYNKTKIEPPVIVYGKKKTLIRKRATWVWAVLQATAAAAILLLLIIPGKTNVDNFIQNKDYTALSEIQNQLNTANPISNETKNKTVPQQTNNTSTPVSLKNEMIQKKSAQEPSLQTENPVDYLPQTTENSFPKIEPVEFIATTGFSFQVSSLQTEAYEKGLAVMIPTFINNQRMQNAIEIVPDENTSADASILEKGADFFARLIQKELAFRKVYDTDGNVVAINVKSGEFEMSQRLPRLLRR